MPKRKETLFIESALADDTRKKRIYGSGEVTIGFAWQGMGHEIVDYITIDTKDIIRCYEIKVTMEDLKSRSRKSFYGHYNYLVVTSELYEKMKKSEINLESYGIPVWAGIKICYTCMDFKTIRKAVKQDIGMDQVSLLKTSMIRSMYWKNDKYRQQEDGTALKKAKQEASKYKRMYTEEHKRYSHFSGAVYHMQHKVREKLGVNFHIFPDFSADEWTEEILSLIERYLAKP